MDDGVRVEPSATDASGPGAHHSDGRQADGDDNPERAARPLRVGDKVVIDNDTIPAYLRGRHATVVLADELAVRIKLDDTGDEWTVSPGELDVDEPIPYLLNTFDVTVEAEPEPWTDWVANPPHYTSHPSGIEPIQITKHMSFCLGNVVKYCLRAGLKGDGLLDLKKARQYLDWEIELYEEQN